MKARVVSIVLLAIGAAGALVAWTFQNDAATYFVRAAQINAAPVRETGGPPPEVSDNRAILETLDESIEIRRDIDGRLGALEQVIAALQGQQSEAADVSRLARLELQRIGANLGGARGAARGATRGLDDLSGGLAESLRLARLIADELAELDRSFGP